MEAFGKRLTEARTRKGLEFDQIARETNIARRYLEALEAEDFAVFPGEPYLLGFLRNYSEYLGLPSNEIITSYKNFKIQEAPIPLRELMPARPVSEVIFGRGNGGKVLIGFLIVLAVGALAGGGYAIGSRLLAGGSEKPAEVARDPVLWTVDGSGFSERVFAGDTINVSSNGNTWSLVVEETAPVLKMQTPVGSRVIELGQELSIDLSGNDEADVRVFVADLYKNDPSKGAEVRIDIGSGGEPAPNVAAQAVQTEAATDVTLVVDTPAAADTARQTVLFESGSAYPVTMNATFRGYCLFRYESDRTTRDERYYQKSELLTVQANNGIRVWASNGNAVKIQMIAGGKTVDLEISRPGEVIVRDLKWIKDEESGRFKFISMEID